MFNFTNDQVEIKKHIAGSSEVLRFHNIDGNNIRYFMEEALKVVGRLGYLGMSVPEKYGGTGLDTLSAATALVEFAKVNAALAHIVNAHSFCFITPLVKYGSEKQKNFYLSQLAAGQKIGTFAFTEPDGSNVNTIRVTAKRINNGYLLNGTKCMITYAGCADYALIFTRTGPAGGGLERSFSFFIADLKQTEGITIGKPEMTMGMEGTQIAEINFHDCKVPADDLLGREGDGLEIIADMLETSRTTNAAVALGIALAAYEEAVKYAHHRSLNGKPLIQHPVINAKLAGMYCKLQSMELNTYYTAQNLAEKKKNVFTDSSVVKYMVAETAKEICDASLQIHGGYGYIKDYFIEQLYRDVRINTIMGGTSETILSEIGGLITQKISQERQV